MQRHLAFGNLLRLTVGCQDRIAQLPDSPMIATTPRIRQKFKQKFWSQRSC